MPTTANRPPMRIAMIAPALSSKVSGLEGGSGGGAGGAGGEGGEGGGDGSPGGGDGGYGGGIDGGARVHQHVLSGSSQSAASSLFVQYTSPLFKILS